MMDYVHSLSLFDLRCTGCMWVRGCSGFLSLMAVLSPVVSSRVIMPWWLDEAARGLYGFVASRRVHQWAKSRTLVTLAPDVGSTVSGGGAGSTAGFHGALGKARAGFISSLVLR